MEDASTYDASSMSGMSTAGGEAAPPIKRGGGLKLIIFVAVAAVVIVSTVGAVVLVLRAAEEQKLTTEDSSGGGGGGGGDGEDPPFVPPLPPTEAATTLTPQPSTEAGTTLPPLPPTTTLPPPPPTTTLPPWACKGISDIPLKNNEIDCPNARLNHPSGNHKVRINATSASNNFSLDLRKDCNRDIMIHLRAFSREKYVAINCKEGGKWKNEVKDSALTFESNKNFVLGFRTAGRGIAISKNDVDYLFYVFGECSLKDYTYLGGDYLKVHCVTIT